MLFWTRDPSMETVLYSSLVENTILMSVDKVIPQMESGLVSEQGKF